MKKLIYSFILTFLFCTVTLFLVYHLPLRSITEHAQKSALTLKEEGLSPRRFGVTLDTFTDAIMIGTASYNSELPAWQAAMSSSYAKEKGMDPIESLTLYTEGNSKNSRSYSRYWHGYLILLKPLLLIFDYSQIRILNCIIMLIALFSILYLIKKNRLPMLYGICFLFCVFIFGGLALPFSLQLSNMFFLMYAVLIYLLLFHNKLAATKSFSTFFLVTGMLTSFFDFLTVPMLTLGIPMLFCLLLHEMETNTKFIIKNSIAWGFGYGSFWCAKWILATITLHDNIISNALSSASERSSMQLNDTKINYFQVIKVNFECLNNRYVFLLAALLIIILIYYIRKHTLNLSLYSFNSLPSYLLCCFMPFAWYLVFSNHSFEHNWFTYRELLICVLGFFFYLCRLCTNSKAREKDVDSIPTLR